jgi:hypothetical protein
MHSLKAMNRPFILLGSPEQGRWQQHGCFFDSAIGMFQGRMEALAHQELSMRTLLTMMLVLLLCGCERNDATDPEGPGAWLTLGRSGIASAFVRFDSGETETWVAPFTTQFGADGQSLEITLRTERCGDLSFLSVLGRADLQRITRAASAGSAWPCRLTGPQAPAWHLLTKVVNSKQG